MSKVLIKKGGSVYKKIAKELKKSDIESKEITKKKKKPSKKWFFLSIFLLITLSLFLLNGFRPNKSPLTFGDLAFDDTVFFSVIDHKLLYDQISSKIDYYLDKQEVSFGDIALFFKDKSAFVLMPSDDEIKFPSLIILQKKALSPDIDSFLDKIELNLKKDFNFSYRDYRQVEIISLKPLSNKANWPKLYTYSQIEDYLLISNSEDLLESIIDQLIE